MELKPWSTEMRDWQKRAFEEYRRLNLSNFLCVATPGAGKTKLALRIGHKLIEDGIVSRVTVVCPSDHLRVQWAGAANECGIQLDPAVRNDQGLTDDFQGSVVTYAAVGSNPDKYAVDCRRRRTFVVFDEVHHAGDQQNWGQGLLDAFQDAERRLLISGTAWRTDDAAIPFVTYEGGRSRADFSYSYGAALMDGVNRAVMFPHYEGEMRWHSSNSDEPFIKTFKDKIPEAEKGRRLRTALEPDMEWLPGVIAEAHVRLSEARESGDPQAGGLIVCLDQWHAKRIAAIVRKITRREPTLAISEDPLASEKIERFAKSKDEWIVAVRLVSEGVDIPRLRVGVYATNILTELFFRQFVGRFVRMMAHLVEQTAYIYMPADECLIVLAQTIMQEREHVLDQQARDAATEDEQESELRVKLCCPSFYPLGAKDGTLEGMIHEEKVLGAEEVSAARRLAEEMGVRPKLNEADMVNIYRRFQAAAPMPSAQAGETKQEPTHVRLKRLSGQRANLVASLAGKILRLGLFDGKQEKAYKAINAKLWRETGVWKKDANIEQVRQQMVLLGKWKGELAAAAVAGTQRQWVERWMSGS